MDDAFQKELAAMQQVGRDRSRTRTTVFILAWIGIAVLLYALRYGGVQIGLIYIGAISGGLAGGVAVAITKVMTPEFIRRAAKQHGVSEDKLRQDEYLVD